MDPTYSDEAHAFRAKIRSFLGENLPADWRGLRALPANQREGFVADWRAALGEHHLIAPAWPVEYGGGGLSAIERVVLHEEFAQAGVPTGGANDGFGIGMIGPTLMVMGSDEQKSTFLPRILSGEDRWCQGYSEPNSGSDLASLGTRAVRDGDEWVINGQKIWTSEGHTANWIFVLCRTDPDAPKHRGISFLLCPMDQPGIETRPIVNMVGSHDFNEVFFSDAKTHVDNVIGGVNDGWRVTNQLLAYERGDDATTVSLRMQGVLDRLLDVARSTGKINDPVVRQDLAWCHSKVEILRFLGLRSLTAVLSNSVLGPESSINKLLWSELFQRMTEIGVNLFGASATAPDGDAPLSPVFTETTGDPRSSLAMVEHFLGARPASIYSGSNEIQRNIVGERILGLPKEPRADEGPWAETRRAV
ncbi:MAG: alkylation response protein AidB-like acyl-CoA dehydrogenase [Candidatus Poriferisodalaceae bacterium]|jgi:alkylation response protein AidB-like acyl-CoA dehydrogenase